MKVKQHMIISCYIYIYVATLEAQVESMVEGASLDGTDNADMLAAQTKAL